MLILGTIFSLLSGVSAFLITYHEYEHHYDTQDKPKQLAIQSAFLAFVFFFLLSLAIIKLLGF